MTIPRRVFFGLAGAIVLLSCSDRREVPTANAGGVSLSSVGSQGAQHISANGRGVGFVYVINDGTIYEDFSVDAADVNDSSTGGATLVNLYYSSTSCTLPDWTCTYGYGFGSVPNSVLSGSANDERMSLDVNPADYPAFYSYGNPVGLIHVTLTGNGLSTDRTSGTAESVCSPTACPPNGFRRHWAGVTESSSAFATGTVGLVVVPLGSAGSIRKFHNVTLTFEH